MHFTFCLFFYTVPSKTDDKITSALAVPEMHSRIPRKTIPVHWKESRERREGEHRTIRNAHVCCSFGHAPSL